MAKFCALFGSRCLLWKLQSCLANLQQLVINFTNKEYKLYKVHTFQVNLTQAFFHLHCVHHRSLLSIPYTFRHFFPSLLILAWTGEPLTPVLGGMTKCWLVFGDAAWCWCCLCSTRLGLCLTLGGGDDGVNWRRKKRKDQLSTTILTRNQADKMTVHL